MPVADDFVIASAAFRRSREGIWNRKGCAQTARFAKGLWEPDLQQAIQGLATLEQPEPLWLPWPTDFPREWSRRGNKGQWRTR